MFGIGVIAACVVLGLAGYGTEAFQPVPVTVYYESYCPDSIKFETQSLYPLLQNTNFSLNIDLKLVPYGKSSYTLSGDVYNFTCHHGEKECYGNKVQSCALKHISSKRDQLEFINCVMKEILADKTQTYPTKKCGGSIQGIEQVEACANGQEGNVLLAANGDLTQSLNPPLKSVPTVVINNTVHADSNINLKALVCEHLAPLNLTECATVSGSSHLVSGFLSLFTTALLVVFARA